MDPKEEQKKEELVRGRVVDDRPEAPVPEKEENEVRKVDARNEGHPNVKDFFGSDLSMLLARSGGCIPEGKLGYGVVTFKSEVAKSMAPALYRMVIAGDKKGLEAKLEDAELNLLTQVTPKEDTIFHLAARLGHTHLVEPILGRCPDLFMRRNSSSDYPLHLAASNGHFPLVKFVISEYRDQARASEIRDVVNSQNNEGNTPLHLALKNRHSEVANLLFIGSEKVPNTVNKEGKSPLYMAAEAGYQDLFERMMKFTVSTREAKEKLRNGKPLLHAAIKSRNKGILQIALEHEPSLLDIPDTRGRKPLSYAASIGYLEGVCYILDKFDQEAYKRDEKDGSCPIHWAASKGHIGVIQEILRRFPDSMDILNGWGQNILHVATECGKTNVVSHILQDPQLEMLINGRDNKGNTPLHLATLNSHPKVVSMLTWDKRVRLELENNDGLTALDAALLCTKQGPSFRQRLTWIALKQANAPRGHSTIPLGVPGNLNPLHMVSMDRVNTLLLVATLVTTVTYASGVAVPGGFDDTDSDRKGTAVLLRKAAFQVFLISDIIALYTSIMVAITLVWAQLGDMNLAVNSLKYALPLLGISLSMVSLAFMAGVYVVVSNLVWMAWLVLVLGSISILSLMILLVLLLLPISVKNQVLRRIVYYPFCLLILLSKSKADEIDSDEP